MWNGNSSVVSFGWTFADHDLGRHVGPRLPLGAGAWDTQRAAGAQAGDELALECTAALDIEGLVDL